MSVEFDFSFFDFFVFFCIPHRNGQKKDNKKTISLFKSAQHSQSSLYHWLSAHLSLCTIDSLLITLARVSTTQSLRTTVLKIFFFSKVFFRRRRFPYKPRRRKKISLSHIRLSCLSGPVWNRKMSEKLKKREVKFRERCLFGLCGVTLR